MKRNIATWIREVLSSDERRAVPVLSSPGYSLIGRKVIDGVRNGKVQAMAVRALADRYPVSASVMMMDLSVEAEAFGTPVQYHENEIPVVKAPLDQAVLAGGVDMPALSVGRILEYLDAARYLAEMISDRPVLAGCIGPFSLAGRLFGMTEIMIETMVNPEGVVALLDACNGFLLEYIRAYKSTGVDGIIVAEPAAGMLSPDMCDTFSSAYVKTIVDAVQDDDFLVVLHNCGNTGILNGSMIRTGAGAIHVGNRNPVLETLSEAPDSLLVMGNVDPANVLKLGTPETVGTETGRLLEATERFRNFILSSGCDIPTDTPAANMDAFMFALKRYNSARGRG